MATVFTALVVVTVVAISNVVLLLPFGIVLFTFEDDSVGENYQYRVSVCVPSSDKMS